MFRSKYSNFLTIVLVVAIVLVLAIAIVIGVSTYKKYSNNKQASTAISMFDNITDSEEGNTTEQKGEELIEQNIVVSEPVEENATSNSKTKRKVTYYNDFVMIGYIEIPSIKIKYPILEKETVQSLEQSVAVRYPNNPKLNEVGNVVIAGHNYRNGMFFSNLKKVNTGDKISIKDNTGRTVVYTIYEKYETTPEDVAYMSRNVGDNVEVTLVTCTDNGKARIVVKARA